MTVGEVVAATMQRAEKEQAFLRKTLERRHQQAKAAVTTEEKEKKVDRKASD